MLLNPFRIDWNASTGRRWDRMLAACQRPTLTQSWQYAAAKASTTGEIADHGIIYFHDQPVGLVQVERRRLLGPFAGCELYRGPLWIHAAIPSAMQKLVLGMLRQRYVLYRGKTFNFHPELTDTESHRAQLKSSGFTRTGEGYSTIWVDLQKPLDTLHSRLRQKWRNSLNQAARNKLELDIDRHGGQLDWLIEKHTGDMAERGYVGPSATLLRNLHKVGQPTEMIHTLRALHRGRPIGAIMLARHGKAATYLVGWTGDEGRRLNAHHFLLWRAVEYLKASGSCWLDLGGHNETTAAGVARFKLGLGGDPVTLVGAYR